MQLGVPAGTGYGGEGGTIGASIWIPVGVSGAQDT